MCTYFFWCVYFLYVHLFHTIFNDILSKIKKTEAIQTSTWHYHKACSHIPLVKWFFSVFVLWTLCNKCSLLHNNHHMLLSFMCWKGEKICYGCDSSEYLYVIFSVEFWKNQIISFVAHLLSLVLIVALWAVNFNCVYLLCPRFVLWPEYLKKLVAVVRETIWLGGDWHKVTIKVMWGCRKLVV